ncbi:MAG: alpha/beta fold hydrolase [Candidatus Melainabacteria bacterium]|nr:alpha/beta fold hydrolase [Candidatus Melainabacteria bacterium]
MNSLKNKQFALTAVLALSLSVPLQARSQGTVSEEETLKAPVESSETGAKSLRAPTVAPQDIKCISWLPTEKPRAAMLCIHGFSLHKGCFAAFGKEMAKDGVAVYAMDLRGFGELKDTKSTNSSLDFDGCLVDIKIVLETIHKNHPGLPVVILGESMGGALALRATAFYPELIDGLIASVPARDRYGLSSGETKVGLKGAVNTIFGGYDKKVHNAALGAVQKISAKDDVRAEWTKDPLMRTDFSLKEFVQLDKFMSGNLAAADLVKKTPVLFVQGTNDKLIRPAGTWKLFERLNTANRQMVFSKNSEHLLFEEGQFKPDDLTFVTTWIDRNIAALDPKVVVASGKLPVVASKEEYSGTDIASSEDAAKKPVVAVIPPKPEPTEFKNKIASLAPPQINFWIELNRDGKTYRCNNKMAFKSGDAIRFHLIPGSDGFAYLVMQAGTTGKSDVLFPNKQYGMHNHLKKGQDYPIPSEGWMQFDDHPGTEQLGLVFANEQVDVTPESLKNRTLTAFVSPDESGAKDLCPTRMKLSWDDPAPTLIPDDFSAVAQLHKTDESSLVRLMGHGTGARMVSASIQLMHGK